MDATANNLQPPRPPSDNEEGQDEQPAELFPPPPPFFRLFTSENILRLAELQAGNPGIEEERGRGQPDFETGETMADAAVTKQAVATQSAAGSVQSHSLADLPEDLKFLVPPEIPQDGKYQCFGAFFDVYEKLLPLSDLGIEQVYPSPPTTEPENIGDTTVSNNVGQIADWSVAQLNNLRNITKSIMLRYLELVETLASNPSDFGSKVSSLTTLFLNAHHIINEYRPHQARESIIGMLSKRIEKCEKEIAEVEKVKTTVASIFAAIAEPDFLAQAQAKGGQAPSQQQHQLPALGSVTSALYGRSGRDPTITPQTASSMAPSSYFPRPISPAIPAQSVSDVRPDTWATLEESLVYGED